MNSRDSGFFNAYAGVTSSKTAAVVTGKEASSIMSSRRPGEGLSSILDKLSENPEIHQRILDAAKVRTK